MTIKEHVFGPDIDGKPIYIYTLTNSNGLLAKITNFGGILASLLVPDRNGNPADVVLGYDNLNDYRSDRFYFGATVGRYANRIAKGVFTLNGVEYYLAKNDVPNHLHGGIRGFHKVVWDSQAVEETDRIGVKLHYLSKDGEEGYPGNLECTVVYWLSNRNELIIEYRAHTDKPTPVNLSHHSYFNLAGEGQGDILNHVLKLNADYYIPFDRISASTGEPASVKNTALDFRQASKIGARIDEIYGGYDHNFVLNKSDDPVKLSASVTEEISGRQMDIYTTKPGIQFYAGNYLDGLTNGKSGHTYHRHSGFCLEPQYFPDSPNQPEFPSPILAPEDIYNHRTVYHFVNDDPSVS